MASVQITVTAWLMLAVVLALLTFGYALPVLVTVGLVVGVVHGVRRWRARSL